MLQNKINFNSTHKQNVNKNTIIDSKIKEHIKKQQKPFQKASNEISA